MGKTNEISPELLKLKEDLVSWCIDSGYKLLTTYYEDILEYQSRLASKDIIICDNGEYEYFKTGGRYYFNENLIWIYCCFEECTAAAITINFNTNTAKYSEYTYMYESYYEPYSDKWFNEVDEWNNQYRINLKLSIYSALIKFSSYIGENIPIDLKNLDNNITNTIITDFIYKIDDSNKLEIQFDDDTIEDFISNDISELTIIAVDTKTPLIKIRKENDNFIFIVDITNEDGDSFVIRSKFSDEKTLNKLIKDTIEALQSYSQFNKYADELENCL